jgi:phosphoribosylformimino-5-aminoimidazole carboxamide ribonucleotide (ProFAR) isomerase
MKTFLLIATIILTKTSVGNAVSRVGGGKVSSQQSDFEMTFNLSFQQLDQNGKSVKGIGSVVFASLGIGSQPITQFYELTEFADEFPDAVTLTKSELIERFSKSQWHEVPSPSACAVLLRTNNRGVIAYIMNSGEGKGFVLKGTNTPETELLMENAIKTLVISEGGCKWK